MPLLVPGLAAAMPVRASRIAQVLSLVTVVASQTFDCLNELTSSWTVAHKAWCCSNQGLGCEAADTASSTREDTWAISCSKDCHGRDVCEQACSGDQKQVHACPKQADCPLNTDCADQEPEDCSFAEWSDWSTATDCAGLCYRSRNIATPNRCGGKPCEGALEDSKSCQAPESCKAEVQDCRFSTWSDWRGCGEKVRCQRERVRSIDQLPTNGGELCEGPLSETEVCGSDCNEGIDCVLSVWGEWSACNAACGIGERSRLRTIISRAANGGRPCDGQLTESEGCEQKHCETAAAADCQLGDWSEWSACDSGSQRSRSRQITQHPTGGGQACSGDLEHTTGCGSKAAAAVEACEPSDWSEWQLCDRTCGGGQTFRTRQLGAGSSCKADADMSTIETVPCNTASCSLDKEPCRVGTWSDWSTCSTTCGAGQQTRDRRILSEAAAGGQACALPLSATRSCDADGVARPLCDATDCLWADWQDWGRCTKTCGGTGQQTRVRSISQEATVGGLPCAAADAAQVRSCGEQPCHVVVCVDGAWADWSEWSICSKSCRGGFRWHSRRVAAEANRCGSPPTGPATEEQPCNEDFPCSADVDCKLSDWSEWSKCDDECRGNRMRTREVIVSVAADGKCGDEQVGMVPLQEVKACRGAEDGTDKCGDTLREQCVFGSWSDWSQCSVSCGGGQTVRMRTNALEPASATPERRLAIVATGGVEQSLFNCSQNLGEAAEGWSVGKKEWCCTNMDVGCSLLAKETFDCGLDSKDRGLWSSEKREFCCRTKKIGCDDGANRTANLCDGSLLQTHHCNTFECDVTIVDCSYGVWSEWTACTACQQGERTRHREVVTQAQNGGVACRAASTTELQPCPDTCATDGLYYCVWGEWTQDAQCSTSCGTGVHRRIRKMELSETKPDDAPWAVANDDNDCTGNLTELVPCENNPSCAEACVPQDCALGEWTEWSEPTCDGLCRRSRQITQMNNDCGEPCSGSLNATKSCPADCSSKDCKLSDWSGWSTCLSESDQSYNTRQVLQFPTVNGMVCSGVLNQTGSCKTGLDAPVDCELSEWSDWTECDVSCGFGQRLRERSVVTEAANGGSSCDGPVRLLKSCGLENCGAAEPEVAVQQNCSYGKWSEWSACKGRSEEQAYRSRVIKTFGSGGGKMCDEEVMQTQGCVAESAADQDCVFSDWSGWSACPVSCGGGQNTRSRIIREHATGRGKSCSGAKLEAGSCGLVKCPGEEERKECKFTGWSDWGPCSASCGEGYQARRRALQEPALAGAEHCARDLAESQPCQVQLCEHAKDCAWGTWSAWSDCEPSPDICGVGFKKRSRDIAQMPSGGGALCVPGVKEQVMPVEQCQGQPPCCVNGRWGEWEDWSPCSAKCGSGTRKRARPVAVKETWCGDPAPGSSEEYEGCEAPGCGADHDCEFNGWSEWSPCSMDCHGNRTRHRSIKVHALGAGAACRGDLEVVERCNPGTGQPQPWSCETQPSAPKAARDCLMAEWSDWSPCSQTCEGGYHTRERHIQIHPEKGGRSCETSLKEVSQCNADVACFAGRVDCMWQDWTSWSECNNLRFQYRSRGMGQQAAGGGAPCTGDVRELQPCSGGTSASMDTGSEHQTCAVEDYTCGWGQWTGWSQCSQSCGSGGTRSRERKLQVSAALAPAAVQQKFALEQLEGRLRDLEGHRLQDSAAAFGFGFASLTLVLLLVRGLRPRPASGRGATPAGEYDAVPQHA